MGQHRRTSRWGTQLGTLRVLVANEDRTRLEAIVAVAERIGQVVVAREVEVSEVAERAREVHPDLAVVGLHEGHTEHALGMIEEIIGEGICPVVAVVEDSEPEFVTNAARSGIFAFVDSLTEDAFRGAFDIAMRRFGQAEELEGALARRAIIERAKGVLMERYGVGEREAFERLRAQSQRTGEKVASICQALLDSHALMREVPLDPRRTADPRVDTRP